MAENEAILNLIGLRSIVVQDLGHESVILAEQGIVLIDADAREDHPDEITEGILGAASELLAD